MWDSWKRGAWPCVPIGANTAVRKMAKAGEVPHKDSKSSKEGAGRGKM